MTGRREGPWEATSIDMSTLYSWRDLPDGGGDLDRLQNVVKSNSMHFEGVAHRLGPALRSRLQPAHAIRCPPPPIGCSRSITLGRAGCMTAKRPEPKVLVSRQLSRAGKRLVGGHYDGAVLKALKELALQQDTTVQALLARAINDLLEKHGRPRLASEALLPRGGGCATSLRIAPTRGSERAAGSGNQHPCRTNPDALRGNRACPARSRHPASAHIRDARYDLPGCGNA